MSKFQHTPGPWIILDEDELKDATEGDPPFGIWSDDDENGASVRICAVQTEVTNKPLPPSVSLPAWKKNSKTKRKRHKHEKVTGGR